MSSPMPDLSDLDWAIVNLQATIEAHVETLVSAAREEERARYAPLVEAASRLALDGAHADIIDAVSAALADLGED